MADPTPYDPSYSFSGFQASNPKVPLLAPKLDNELANIELTTTETINALKDIRRSDGKLKNGVVTIEAMETSLQALIAAVPGLAAGAAASATAAAGSASAAAGSAAVATTQRSLAEAAAIRALENATQLVISTQAQAEAGALNDKGMTPLRTRQFMQQDFGDGSPVSSKALGIDGTGVLRRYPLGILGDTSTRTPYDFGATGITGQNQTTAMQAAVAWLNAQRGRTLLLPGDGVFEFYSDLRLLVSNTTIRSLGGRATLKGRNNARLILGEGIEGAPSGGKPTKTGTKIVDTRIENVSFQPGDEHEGENLLLDYCDTTRILGCSFGSSSNDGTKVQHGIKCRWTQWTYIEENEIYVNGYPIYIRLEPTATQNEDHYHIHRNQLYIAKKAVQDFIPAGICVERVSNNNYSIFEFSACHNHIGKFLSTGGQTPSTVLAGGIKLISNQSASDEAIFLAASLDGNFYEYIAYPIDFRRGIVGAFTDTSSITIKGGSCLQSLVAFDGTGTTKQKCSIDTFHIEQSGTGFNGIRMHFMSRISFNSVTTLFVGNVNLHRFANKQTGAGSVAGIRLQNQGTQAVVSGETSKIITHSLSMTPTIVIPVSLSTGWTPNFSVTGITSTQFQVNFNDPLASKSFSWFAMVPDA